jgi:multidrug resistance efflux pump
MPQAGDDGPWLTISEAAERSGRKIDAMRALARRGRVPRRKGNRGEWLVQLPETPAAVALDTALDVHRRLDAAEREVSLLRDRLAAAEAELTAARAVAAAKEVAAERVVDILNEQIAELRADRDRLAELLRKTLERPGLLERLLRALRGARSGVPVTELPR